jgi:predicted metal-dependent hydrolase
MPRTHTIAGIEVEVRRGGVRRLNLHVTSDGLVWVSAPSHVSSSDIIRFISANRAWIERRTEAVSRENRRSELRAGDEVRLWGEELELVFMDPSGRGRGMVEAGRLLLPLNVAGREDRGMRRAAYDSFMKGELASALPDVARRCEQRVCRNASSWVIRHMRSRWGSCNTRTGRICMNSELCCHAPSCLEYVTTHELCHLIEPSHGAAFKALMDTFYPDWRSARAELNRQPPLR